jgi:hypothetical protein
LGLNVSWKASWPLPGSMMAALFPVTFQSRTVPSSWPLAI